MKNTVLFSLFGLMLIACSTEPEVIHLRTVKHTKKVKHEVKSNSKAFIEIKGMSCEMGCGGSIRKALKSTKAVSRVSFDFEEGREIQIATIEYDTMLLNTNKIESIISKLNDGQFEVMGIKLN